MRSMATMTITAAAAHIKPTNTDTRPVIATVIEKVSTKDERMILGMSTLELYEKRLTDIGLGWVQSRPFKMAIATDIGEASARGTRLRIRVGDTAITMIGGKRSRHNGIALRSWVQ